MKKYHKIQTVYDRDPENNFKTILEGQYSLPEFIYLQDNIWSFSEKLDGTNIRIMFDGEKITFGGKSDDSQIPGQLFNNLNSQFLPQMDLFKNNFPENVCLYGEGVGAKIQKGGGNYSKEQKFVLFDVLIGDWLLRRADVEYIAGLFGLETAPIIGNGTLLQMVELAKIGFNSNWGDFLAEGIVARPAVELKARNGNRIITKIKYKDFIRA